MYSVFGVENPLLDFICQVDFPLFKTLGTRPGTMNLVSLEEMKKVLGIASGYRNTPGGSCANTIRGIAWLGQSSPIAPPVYSGAVGSDERGEKYIACMREMGIEVRLVRKQTPTGCSVILVTPDHERTMFTYLGACREFTAQDLDLEALSRSRFLHLTGYLWDTENQRLAAEAAARHALRQGVKVSFDLADPFVVQRYRSFFVSWIPGRVEVVFANREELQTMMGEKCPDEELVRRAGWLAGLVVMKVGAGGCYLNEGGRIMRSQGFPARVQDTTAAGDSFASGFLFGLLKGYPTTACARLANRFASQIVGVNGCDFSSLDPRGVQ